MREKRTAPDEHLIWPFFFRCVFNQKFDSIVLWCKHNSALAPSYKPESKHNYNVYDYIYIYIFGPFIEKPSRASHMCLLYSNNNCAIWADLGAHPLPRWLDSRNNILTCGVHFNYIYWMGASEGRFRETILCASANYNTTFLSWQKWSARCPHFCALYGHSIYGGFTRSRKAVKGSSWRRRHRRRQDLGRHGRSEKEFGVRVSYISLNNSTQRNVGWTSSEPEPCINKY